VADGDRQLLGERRSFGPFALLPAERLLTRDGILVEIGGRSFDLLVVLTEQPGQILSKRDLLKRVWPDVVVEDGSLRFHMAGLRKLLGEGTDGARYIATQVGVGYAFVAPVAVQGPETVRP
jgi:DNA-binding winged helix-turn-helix (wHTH) protein